MTILSTDVKLLESERMSDTTDGGGRRTSRVVADGVSGNIFPKVSRLDSTYGRVNFRKIFGAVQTANLDTYAGAHAIITEPPENDRINVTIFSTSSEFDTRLAARDRVESYVTAGPETRMTLLGRQLAGQQSISVYQRVDEPLPEVGDVLCLSAEAGSVVSASQYIRVQSLEHEVRTFTEALGQGSIDFQRRVLTIGTGTPLRYEFMGRETATQLTTNPPATRVRATSSVDAARYYGIAPLAAPAAAGDLTVKLASIYTQLVPTTTRETAVPNATPASAGGMTPCASTARSEILAAAGWAAGASRRTLRGIAPGSATLSAGGGAITDNGEGAFDDAAFSGTIDYDLGLITRTGGSSGASSWTISYVPAVRATQIAHTRDVNVNLANRGLIYIQTLNPLPAPGAVSLSYLALGKWYLLRDNGAGELLGDAAEIGRGTIDYATGVAQVTLGALPDVGSALLWSWASPAHYVVRAGASSDAGSVEQIITLDELPVYPGSVEVTYQSGGVAYTASDDGAGTLAGNGLSGSINYASGETLLRYTSRLPDALSSVAVSYNRKMPVDPEAQVSRQVTLAANSTMSLGESVAPGTLSGSVPFAGVSLFVKSTENGLLVVPGGQVVGALGKRAQVSFFQGTSWSSEGSIEGAVVAGDQVIGTVNHSTGAITISADVMVSGNTYRPTYVYQAVIERGWEVLKTTPTGTGVWEPSAAKITWSAGTAFFGFDAGGVAVSPVPVSALKTFTDAPLRFPVRSSIGDRIVPNSVILALGGKEYIDRNGTLYADVSTTTGAGVAAGQIDYSAGLLSLSYWANGATPAIDVHACLSAYGEYSIAELMMRTAGAPLRPGSFYIQAADTAGNLVNGQANNAGEVSGTGVDGDIDQQTGICRLRFGDLVEAAGNEDAWWYDASNVVNGQVWRPRSIIPSTIRYNVVVYTRLPLNADLLGLDPVRLPVDGRVPMCRPADVAVIHNIQRTVLPNPAAPGATYNAGRADLAEIWLEDAGGQRVNVGLYETVLETGAITLSPSLDPADYAQPLVAFHRIEDMVLVSDVQITGEVTFDPALVRAYPVESSYLSSALLFGDMVARVTNVHDLKTWSQWDDSPTGAGANWEFNTIDYPIEVLNNGAVTERWRINFTSTTAFQVIGENLGVLAVGDTGTDCAPANGLTGLPYFVIRAAGWGMGQGAGDQLRFNTVSAAAPIWIARTILPRATLDGDKFALQLRGDVDAE